MIWIVGGINNPPRSRVSLRGNALPDALRHEPVEIHYFLVMWDDLILADEKIKYHTYLSKRTQRVQEGIPTQGRDGNERVLNLFCLNICFF